jgi:hypothetical protein
MHTPVFLSRAEPYNIYPIIYIKCFHVFVLRFVLKPTSEVLEDLLEGQGLLFGLGLGLGLGLRLRLLRLRLYLSYIRVRVSIWFRVRVRARVGVLGVLALPKYVPKRIVVRASIKGLGGLGYVPDSRIQENPVRHFL